jgi:hypothetical protein
MIRLPGTLLTFALVAVSLTATQALAQSIYATPYAFTNLAGYSQGTNDGTGTAARFNQPEGVAVDNAGNVYVADRASHTIRLITPGGVVTTLAGTGGLSGANNGTGSAARFNGPTGLAVDGTGNIYVADSGNNSIRKVTPAGVVTTLAGGFDRPYGVAVDSATNVYVSDWFNDTIRKVTPAGLVTTLAGLVGVSGTNDGTGTAARFNSPQGLAVDSATNVYVGDSGNYTIRKITPAGVVTTVAGTGGQYGTNDATGSAARFRWPNGVAVDSLGNIFVVDQEINTIRKITPAGVVTTLAGRAYFVGRADGIGSAARFWSPSGLALDSAGNIYVGDMVINRITKGTPALLFDSSPGNQVVSNGFFQMRLTWPFATNVVVEASPDLQGWTPIQTNVFTPDSLGLSVPFDPNQNQFFRARLSP